MTVDAIQEHQTHLPEKEAAFSEALHKVLTQKARRLTLNEARLILTHKRSVEEHRVWTWIFQYLDASAIQVCNIGPVKS